MARNPNFTGKVSILGHSLGSLVIFDLLCNQDKATDNYEKPALVTPGNEMDLSNFGKTSAFDNVGREEEIRYGKLKFEVETFFGGFKFFKLTIGVVLTMSLGWFSNGFSAGSVYAPSEQAPNASHQQLLGSFRSTTIYSTTKMQELVQYLPSLRSCELPVGAVCCNKADGQVETCVDSMVSRGIEREYFGHSGRGDGFG